MGEAVERIALFCKMVIDRERGLLPASASARIDAIASELRTIIDGACPLETPAVTPPPTITMRAAEVSLTAEEATHEVLISGRDAKKMVRVDPRAPSSSAYTRPRKPVYLGDYYDDIPTEPGRSELSEEARVLLGISSQPSQAPVRPSLTPVESIDEEMQTNPAFSADVSLPAKVLLRNGKMEGGQLTRWPPDATGLRFAGRKPIPLLEVVVIFLGCAAGAAPHVSSGQRMVVTLADGRRLLGASPDYAPGVEAMTLIPDEAGRGSVDRVWIPAWSVREIVLS